MSVFNWFSRKPPLQQGRGPSSVGEEGVAARREPGQGGRRSERSERREQLYGVVRDVMVRAGVLSASYKFKVLSLDNVGQRFVVMMDLARAYAGETARLTEIELMLAQAAKARMGAAVTAVYWRISDQIGVPQSLAAAAAVRAPQAVPTPAMAAVAPQRRRQDTAFEPIDEQEMAAFKLAVAAAPATASNDGSRSVRGAAAAPVVRRSGPLLGPGSGDRATEFQSSEMGHLDLGVTQYGELR
ncbi:MAG: hypothetical protein LBI66_00040 [Burkholderiaceae bacterium]|jgi:hypothetical protein|nr:hypothetical protein [Burkholderiaceae bacterium]